MDMRKWLDDVIESDTKKALPVLSFPAIQKMGITVKELIASSERQAEAIKVVADNCNSAASVSFMDLSVEAEAFGSETVVSDDEVPTVTGSIITGDDDPDIIKVPEVGAGRTHLYIKAMEESAKVINDRPVLAGMIGPFSLAGRLMNVNDVMMYCRTNPEAVLAVVRKATDFLKGYAEAYAKTGCDGIVMAEPLAGVLSPKQMKEFSTPFVKEIIDAVQTDEFAMFYHNCGNTTPFAIDDIVTIGAYGYHFGNAVDIEELLPHIPENAICMGNVDPAGEFRMGTPESIREATLAVLDKCSKFKNYVPSSGCDVPPMSKWENIDMFFKTVDEYYAK